jgi:predicted nucleic acid-binding protein
VKPAVLNASPLIVLAKAGYLDLVPRIVSPVVIPRAVANEISTGRPDDPAVQFLARRSRLSVADLVPALSPLATWHLGQGESEVLEYARRNSGTVAVLDDKAARRVARALDIPSRGPWHHRCSCADEATSVSFRSYRCGWGLQALCGFNYPCTFTNGRRQRAFVTSDNKRD